VGAERLQRSMLADAFGADGLPKGLAFALAAVSTAIAVRAFQAHRRTRRQATLVSDPHFPDGGKRVSDPHFPQGGKPVSDPHFPDGGKPVSDPHIHLRALGVVVLGFGYVALAPWIGFLPAVALLIGATAIYFGGRPSATVVLLSITGGVVLWLVFARMLGVSMPVGLWARLLG
jgi:hypothetical protein